MNLYHELIHADDECAIVVLRAEDGQMFFGVDVATAPAPGER